MSGISKLSNFLASLAAQVRAAAIGVGVPADDVTAGRRRTDEFKGRFGPSDAQRWDDAPGRVTRNGLGSLEIGAGKTRIDE